MKTWLYTAVLMGLTALPITAAAEDKFTVRVDGLQNGHFAQRHLLSEAYGFGCTGGNIAPTISWKNAPKGTKSFVLTIADDVRQRRAHRLGLDALGGCQYSRPCAYAA